MQILSIIELMMQKLKKLLSTCSMIFIYFYISSFISQLFLKFLLNDENTPNFKKEKEQAFEKKKEG